MTIAIQTAGLISAFQYCITVATAEYSVHTSITPAKKYVQPIANPKAGSTKRDASSKIDPRMGKYAHSSATHKLRGQIKSRPQNRYPSNNDNGPALLRTPPIPTYEFISSDLRSTSHHTYPQTCSNRASNRHELDVARTEPASSFISTVVAQNFAICAGEHRNRSITLFRHRQQQVVL